jgi:hypothetical protein
MKLRRITKFLTTDTKRIYRNGLSITELEQVARGDKNAPPFDPHAELIACLNELKDYTDKHIAKLEQRVKQLETERVNLRYCGVWTNQKQFDAGNMVTHSGAIWHCNERTASRPGSGHPSWTLAVKSGQSR